MLQSLALAWLARLDARARQWPRPVLWGYTFLKWSLVALGAAGMVNWYLEKLRYFDSWY